ncbi:MAG: GspE/PulE family protein [Candidatus Komeilibacteria bacterium]|nr:GspE/PulE family protein [Candidatus Komeilibacteria bacterium]
MIEDKKLKDLLTKDDLIDAKKLADAFKECQEKKTTLFYYLLEKNLVSESVLYNLAADFFKLPLVDLKDENIRKDILFFVPEPIAQAHEIVAFGESDEGIKIATTDPTDLQTIEFLKKRLEKNLVIHLATPKTIKEALKQYHQSLEAEFQNIGKAEQDEPGEKTDQELKELAQDLPIVRVVDTLLEYAIFEDASDIHIEPTEKNVVIRYRLDGMLKEVMTLPKSVQAGLVARIKVLANLKLDEHRLPQDGRFKISSPQYKVAFRVSIIPVFDGEKVVLRLLNESTKTLSLEDLGLQKKQLELLKTGISKPHGIILVTGPTGSGKTTTLYTIMNVLNKPAVNIATIEDPIEYRMPRINQSQVNPKIDFTFAKGLRALLRQDPNIIMVGEIRDKETAEIAANAAMTGHLVLSTLHTNDAVSSPQRLINMGIPSFLVSSTTNLIMAQRLVRKICKNCIYSYTLDKKMIEELDRHFNLKKVFEFLIKEGLLAKDKASSLDEVLFYRGKGCKKCGQTGYKGRVGIYELMEVSPKIAGLITEKASVEQIFNQAIAEGMVILTQDGFIKAITGVTSVEEVLRVTQE